MTSYYWARHGVSVGVLPVSVARYASGCDSTPTEVVVFDQESNDALQTALTSLDLAAANQVVRRWWLLAASRSQRATPAELDVVDRARRGDLAGLSVLQPDGTFSRVA